MVSEILFRNDSMSVIDYRCTATRADKPFTEQHAAFSLSYVRKGSFGCRTGGRFYELIPGSFLIGRAGDEYMCTHEHHACGDQCLSFSFEPALVDDIGARESGLWCLGALPPQAQSMLLGLVGQATAEGRTGMSLDEIGMFLLARFVEVVSGQKRWCSHGRERTCRRVIGAAMRIDAECAEPLSLDQMATWSSLSKFQFLRVFTQVLGLTPHQYLIRCRIGRAAQLLIDPGRTVTDVAFDVGFDDLSNFIRTFTRSAGMSPRLFRARFGRRLAQAA
jgi:AraC family transcriptional regulator